MISKILFYFEEFLFNWGYFFGFLWIFYKNFLPLIQKQVYDFIKEKKFYRGNLLKNLDEYQKQYQGYNYDLSNIKNEIQYLENQKDQIQQNTQIKIKTMKYNSDVQRKKQKQYIYTYYKKKALKNWLHDHENQLIEMIKENTTFNKKNPLPPKNINNKNNKINNKFHIDILKSIDDW
jgi:hypothetical protein